MVSIRSSHDVKIEIMKRYNQNPKNWNVYVAKDPYSHYDIIVDCLNCHNREFCPVKNIKNVNTPNNSKK